jgi:glycosyltransferase involved in cell wall biosynthesis
MVEDQRTGLLVNRESPEELAMALETLLMNDALRAELGAAGAARVAAFDLEPVARRFVEAVTA